MVEFRPPIKFRKARVAMAVVMVTFVLAFLGAMSMLALGGSAPKYTIGDGSLVVTNGAPVEQKRVVSLADITETRLVVLSGGRRTNGTSLPGLCSGKWTYPELGKVWQMTNCSSHALLVAAKGQDVPILITPPDLGVFMQRLHTGDATTIDLPPPDTTGLNITLGCSFTAMAVGIGFLATLIFSGPEKMRYRVGSGLLEVVTIFGRQSFRLPGARVSLYAPGFMWRMMGTALPGYLTGRFRESAKPTRVYATDRTACVLYEGDVRVIVSPEDREGFVREMEREGAKVGG